MHVNQILLLSLAAVATAMPVESVITENGEVSSTPSSSWGPSVTTTLSNLACTQTEDPHLGISGCTCSGNILITPTAGPCPSTWPTTLPGSYYTTLPNHAVVAYETATQTTWDDTAASTQASSLEGSGSSTTLQAGTSLKVELNPTASANIGDGTDPSVRSSLYTAVTNALSTGCPTPVPGSTVTACSSIPAATGISYMDNFDSRETNGELAMDVGVVSYSTMYGYQALIDMIGQNVVAAAQNPNASGQVTYYVAGANDQGYSYDWPTSTFTNIPAYMESFITVEDETTNGEVISQNLGVKFESKQGQGSFLCGIGAEVFSGMAAVGALIGMIPGVGIAESEGFQAAQTIGKTALSGNEFGSVARFGLSVACNQGGGW